MAKSKVEIVETYEDAVDNIISRDVPECTIEGDTGTGKTSLVPTSLARKGKRVFVVISKKLAVYAAYDFANDSENRLLPERVRENMGTAANSIIKYHNTKISNARSFLYNTERIIDQDTQLVYCTPGHMKKVLLDLIKYAESFPKSKTMQFCDYLIVDESHEKKLETEFVIKYWRDLYTIYGKDRSPRLIKMSATVAKPEGIIFRLNKSERPYSVTYRYLDHLEKVIPIPEELKVKTPRFSDIIRFTPTIIKEYILTQVESNSRSCGTMLVFLPGLRDINRIRKELDISLKNTDDLNIGKYEIITVHSSTDNEELKTNILKKKRPTSIRWRIILSTNICETSITIPDVQYVFDTCQERIPVKGNNDVTYLKTDWISQMSAKQRAGRTGRTSDGIVIRCCYLETFSGFQEDRTSEIERLPITTDVLKSMQANIDLKMLLPEITPREMRRILGELSSYCCLLKCGEFYTVTDVGNFVSEIPLSARNATFLYYWMKVSDDYFPGVVIATAIEMVDSLFGFMAPKKLSNIPLGTLVEPFLKLWQKNGTFKPKEYKIRKFANEVGVDFDTFCEALRRIKEIVKILLQKEYECEEFIFDMEECFPLALRCIRRVYTEMVLVRDNCYVEKKNLLKVSTDQTVKQYDLSSNFLKLGTSYPESVYAITFTQNYEKGFRQSISIWTPAKISTKNNVNNEEDESDEEYTKQDDNQSEYSSDESDTDDSDDSSEDEYESEESDSDSGLEFDDNIPKNNNDNKPETISNDLENVKTLDEDDNDGIKVLIDDNDKSNEDFDM